MREGWWYKGGQLVPRRGMVHERRMVPGMRVVQGRAFGTYEENGT